MNIAIVGAGPIGSYAAYQLSKQGFNVHLFDQKPKKELGKPIQCTGLLTSEIKKFIPLNKNFLINTFSHVEVFSPTGKKIKINKTEYLVDRIKFDQHLLNLAIDQGTTFYPKHKLISITSNYQLIFKHKKKENVISPDIIIGADGPSSLITKHLNPLLLKRDYYVGFQATIKGNFNPTTYQTLFNNNLAPELFAWLVPESSTMARIGLATRKRPAHYFTKLLAHLSISPKNIIEKQAGTIPIYTPNLITKQDNIYLLGDAAGHVKATTLGGIIPGFKAAINLTHKLTNRQPPFHISKNLNLHLKIRTILNKFSNQDYHKLINLISKPKIKKLLSTHSRESPKKLLQKIFLKEPRFLRFLKKLF